MVNYFLDFINGLLGDLIPLTMLTKKRYSSGEFILTKSAKIAFEKIKDLSIEKTKLTMTEQNQMVLNIDTSAKAIARIMTKIYNLREIETSRNHVSSCHMPYQNKRQNGELRS